MTNDTMKQAILNRWLNEPGDPPTPSALADMAIEALTTIGAIHKHLWTTPVGSRWGSDPKESPVALTCGTCGEVFK